VFLTPARRATLLELRGTFPMVRVTDTVTTAERSGAKHDAGAMMRDLRLLAATARILTDAPTDPPAGR
jgi:hypothetical protein